MTFALKLRSLSRPAFQQTRLITQSARLSANEYGQGKSHAQGASKVPEGVQKAAPKGVEEALPDSVRCPKTPIPPQSSLPLMTLAALVPVDCIPFGRDTR
jgi:hypothetical protein